MSVMTARLPVENELSSGRRRQRVITGERMVTPTKVLTLTENGRTEELRPGRDRFAGDHAVVRRNPEFFRPADPKDAETNHRHLRRLKGKLGTSTRTSAPSRRRFSLGAQDGRESCRLP